MPSPARLKGMDALASLSKASSGERVDLPPDLPPPDGALLTQDVERVETARPVTTRELMDEARAIPGVVPAAPVESTLGQPLPVKVSRISRFEGQPRIFFNPESLEALADSIQAHGQQQPIKVCRGTEAGKFILIDGERRWRAHNIIWERNRASAERTGGVAVEPTILAFIEVIKNPAEHFRKSVIANLHREDLTPLDEAAALHALSEQGDTRGSLADMIGKSTTYIDNYLKLHQLPDEVKQLMDVARPKERRLNVTSAIDIARSTRDPSLQIEIARESLERELNLIDTRALIETRTGSAGYRVGGFQRKPSDDYKAFSSFLGRTRSAVDKYAHLNFDRMYEYRDNENADRRADQRVLDNMLVDWRKILASLEGQRDNHARSLDALQVKSLILELESLKAKIEVKHGPAHGGT